MKKKELCPPRLAGIRIVLFVTASLFLRGLALADDGSPPTITAFSVTPVTEGEKGAEGGWVELSWQTEAADRVQLFKDGEEMRGRHQLANGEIGWPVSMSGGLKSRLKRPAVFELVAANDHGQVSKTAASETSAKPQAPTAGGPQILSFEASPQTIRPGGTVRFSWQIKDAELVRLHDDQGEIASRIELPSGKLGWPLTMNGALQEFPDRSTTYKLEALSKTGRTSKTVEVTVEQVAVADGDCTVTASMSGKYAKFTDAVGVFQARSGGVGDFLFKSPITTRDGRRGATSSRRASISVPPGEYFLVPSGGGEDRAGPFAVIYKPRRSSFTCRGGNGGRVSFKADFAEY